MNCHYCEAPTTAWALSAMSHMGLCGACAEDERRLVPGAATAQTRMAEWRTIRGELPAAPGLTPEAWHLLACAWLARVATRATRLAPWDPAHPPRVLREAAASTDPAHRQTLLLLTASSPHPGIRAFGLLRLAPEATMDSTPDPAPDPPRRRG